MKPTTLLLTASLLANAGLLAYVALRPPAAVPSASSASTATPSHTAQRAPSEALNAALASGDAAALEAAGVSPEVARQLLLGRRFAQMAEKLRAAQAKSDADGRWWRNRPGSVAAGAREQQLAVRRELSEALMAAFGEDFGIGGGDASQYAFLPAAKRDALRRIVQDYDEMFAKFSAGGLQLASDRERLRLLRQERDRDIAALLTPEERHAYEMRTSMSGNIVRSRYGDAIESEAEFARLYALQKAFDEKFPREALTGRISPEVMRARHEAERQLEADIRVAVGDDRYAALRRAADPDVRAIDSLTARLNLPATTTDAVLTSRDTYASESQRITNDTSLPMPQRRSQIQALASQAKAELARTLGNEAADAYAQSSGWLNMLQSGMAFSTTPPEGSPAALLRGGQGVFPVMPAGTMPAGAQQRVVVNSGPAFEAAAVAVDSLVGGVPGNVQVMSFSTNVVTDADPAGPQRKQVIVAPGTPGVPAQPPPSPRP